MRPKDQETAQIIINNLVEYSQNVRPLLGLRTAARQNTLTEQLLESLRRVEFTQVIQRRPISENHLNPLHVNFDPLRCAIYETRQGRHDEACWLVFLATHFGKHRSDGWRLVRDFYGALGVEPFFTWQSITEDFERFEQWLWANHDTLTGGDRISRRFGDHRKYRTLNPASRSGPNRVFSSYVAWIKSYGGTHNDMIRDIHKREGQNPREVFSVLYEEMQVLDFGRLGKFDFLTMLGKLNLAPIAPDKAYIKDATGPIRGTRLLYLDSTTESKNDNQLDNWIIELDEELQVGMQVLEDALCNWQKSPDVFIPYR